MTEPGIEPRKSPSQGGHSATDQNKMSVALLTSRWTDFQNNLFRRCNTLSGERSKQNKHKDKNKDKDKEA